MPYCRLEKQIVDNMILSKSEKLGLHISYVELKDDRGEGR